MQIQLRYQMPSDIDPVSLSWQQGYAVARYDGMPVHAIDGCFSLDDLILWANQAIGAQGCDGWHIRPPFEISQLMRINLLYHDLYQFGNAKPVLLLYQSQRWQSLTGDSRLRAIELIDHITEINAITVADTELDHDPLHSFNDFAKACGAAPGQQFWFRLGEQGLEWYETAVTTRYPVTGPNFEPWAQDTIKNYVLQQGSTFRFDRDWFCQRHSWLEEIGR